MKTRNIKTIIAFAQSRGMMAMPVVEVINKLQSMKCYHRPRVKVEILHTPKLQLSWMTMEILLGKVKERMDAVSKLFESWNIHMSIVIGGSMALKYQMPQFMDRDLHDLDFIVTPYTEDDFKNLHKALQTMVAAGICQCSTHYYNNCHSFVLGSFWFKGKELPVNIILNTEDMPFAPVGTFNPPYAIFDAKRKYVKAAKAIGKRPRTKDLIDLYKIVK
jgi:hypothetical protein